MATAEDSGSGTLEAVQNGVITEPSIKRETGSLLETHYNELLKTIEEIGRDVKPSYTNNKVSTDRLKKNIMIARGVLRDCMGDLERLAASSN